MQQGQNSPACGFSNLGTVGVRIWTSWAERHAVPSPSLLERFVLSTWHPSPEKSSSALPSANEAEEIEYLEPDLSMLFGQIFYANLILSSCQGGHTTLLLGYCSKVKSWGQRQKVVLNVSMDCGHWCLWDDKHAIHYPQTSKE